MHRSLASSLLLLTLLAMCILPTFAFASPAVPQEVDDVFDEDASSQVAGDAELSLEEVIDRLDREIAEIDALEGQDGGKSELIDDGRRSEITIGGHASLSPSGPSSSSPTPTSYHGPLEPTLLAMNVTSSSADLPQLDHDPDCGILFDVDTGDTVIVQRE